MLFKVTCSILLKLWVYLFPTSCSVCALLWISTLFSVLFVTLLISLLFFVKQHAHYLLSLCTYRYVVCRNLRPDTETVYNYLFAVNTNMCEQEGTGEDVLQVPLSWICLETRCDRLYRLPWFRKVLECPGGFMMHNGLVLVGWMMHIGLKMLVCYYKNKVYQLLVKETVM